jgi:hypothetical protein
MTGPPPGSDDALIVYGVENGLALFRPAQPMLQLLAFKTVVPDHLVDKLTPLRMLAVIRLCGAR